MNSFLIDPSPILSFWFDDGLDHGWPTRNMQPIWFGGGAALDAEIRERFQAPTELAMRGELVEWQEQPLSRLALIILLDQFSRNIWRGQAQAFAGDHRAVTLVCEGISRGMDRHLPWVGRVFFYMPLMHAEDLDLQDLCVDCFQRIVDSAPQAIAEKVQGNLEFAIEHRDIIARFGRFPYRNAVLGRENSAEEDAWLEDGKRYGQ